MQVGTFADKAAQENTHGVTRLMLIVFSRILLLWIDSGNWKTISISIYYFNYNNWKVLWLANRHVSDVGLIWINGWVDGFHSICFYGHDNNNLISICNFYRVDGSDSICSYGHDNPYLSSSTLRKKINIFYLKFRCNQFKKIKKKNSKLLS